MPYILRKIKRSLWLNENCDWLLEDNAQADALKDLQTNDNILSLWEVDNEQQNLGRIIAALASNCDNISAFDYILIEKSQLEESGIQINKNIEEAKTLDLELNNQCHYHAIRLSASKIATVANIMKKGYMDRYPVNRVTELIKQSINNNLIDYHKLSQSVQEKITKKYPPSS